MEKNIEEFMQKMTALFGAKFDGMIEQSLAEKTAKKTDKEDDGEGMDPVGSSDSDIDNDGDSDASDEYLKKRRAAIGKSMKEKTKKKDESSCGDDESPKKLKASKKY